MMTVCEILVPVRDIVSQVL